MRHRSHLSRQERRVRSQLAKPLHKEAFLRGSLVTMARRCGKKECKCNRGEGHVSLYLATKLEKKRKMIYIPPKWEDIIRSWVDACQKVDHLMDQVSEACLIRFLKGKEKPMKKR